MRRSSIHLLILVLTAAAAVGCSGIGPQTIKQDRFDYINAIGDSWKEQMLLNIVKIRYGDVPIFLDVSSVISQYAIESQIDGRLGWNQSSAPGIFRNEAVGGSTKFTDRPTITYTPVSGEKFARSLMTPIQPAAVMSLIQAGYPVDLVLRFCVHSINGVQNDYGGPARTRDADPRFYSLLASLRRIQNAGALGFRVQKAENGKEIILTFPVKTSDQIKAEFKNALEILGLKPGAKEYKLSYGLVAKDDLEISLLTRSVVDMLVDTSSHIEVPASHISEERVNPSRPDLAGANNALFHMIHIHCSKSAPADALAAVKYRGHWFWIDDRDLHSKRLFSFLLFVFALTEPSEKTGAPLVTIPAG